MSIVRNQANQKVSCADPKFDEYVCMIGDPDFISIKTDIIDKCERWKPGTVLVNPLTSKNKDNVKIVSKTIDKMKPARRERFMKSSEFASIADKSK